MEKKIQIQISGGPGAGKTTMAGAIMSLLAHLKCEFITINANEKKEIMEMVNQNKLMFLNLNDTSVDIKIVETKIVMP